MRVIAGKAKGRPLIAPEGFNTRPITSKIKEAIFSSLQTYIPDSYFLDLFAGSGSMGIEAMSRGAGKVVFVEKDRRATEIIKKNLLKCNFTDGYELYQEDVFKCVKWLEDRGYKFDVIYLDPPFTVDEIFMPVMELLESTDILSPDGVILIRTRTEKSMPDSIGNLQKYKLKSYGISSVHYYAKAEGAL